MSDQAGAEESGTEIFGVFDGMTSVLGVVAGLLARPRHVIIAAAIGLAVASAVGMGAGEYLGDPSRRFRRAALMALATAVGTVLPVIPIAVAHNRVVGIVIAGWVAVVVACWIAWVRKRWAETFAVLLVVALATLSVGAVTGVTG